MYDFDFSSSDEEFEDEEFGVWADSSTSQEPDSSVVSNAASLSGSAGSDSFSLVLELLLHPASGRIFS